MSQSRFVFLELLAPGPAADGANTFGWLLVSGNNRVLGRSPALFADFAAGHSAVVVLQRGHGRLQDAVVAVRDTGRWTWQVRLDGVVVAESSRPYLRMRECRYNLERFLAAVPVAGVVPGVRPPRRRERTSADRCSDVDGRGPRGSFGVHEFSHRPLAGTAKLSAYPTLGACVKGNE